MADRFSNQISPDATSSRETFPRWFLLGASALVIASVVIAGVSRVTRFGVSRVSLSDVSQSVAVRFVDGANGTMQILRASDAVELVVLASDGSGFMRGVARSLFRQRSLSKIDRSEPFELARRTNGKYFISDPSLGSRMELDGFGPTNTQTVAAIIEAGLVQKSAGINSAGAENGSAK
jgi:putative photosynthetic complex assembly protein